MKRFIYALIVLPVIWMGCAGNISDDDNYDAQFKEALLLLEKEKYISAQDILNRLAIRASHTELGDDIQYYLAESFFFNDEFHLAIAEYNKLVRKMGFSPLVEDARWRICECYVSLSPRYYLDQISSEKAIDKLQEFIEDFPNSDHKEEVNDTVHNMRNKLAQKALETGILYLKLGAYDSAIITFEHMLGDYYDTEFVSEAHLGIMRSYSAMQKKDEAEKYYHSFKHIFSEDTDLEANNILSNLKSE